MEGPRASDGKTDFLDMFIEAKKRFPDIVDDNVIVVYLLSNVIAGSERLQVPWLLRYTMS